MDDDELLERWEKEDLKPTVHVLDQAQQALTKRGFEFFGAAVNLLLNKVVGAFAEKANCSLEEAVNHSAYLTAIHRTISAFNGTLPLDHPYVVALYGPKGVQCRVIIVSRAALPELRNNLRQDVVPVIVKTTTKTSDAPKKPKDFEKFSDN